MTHRILIGENDDELLSSYQDYFSRQGFEVAATNGGLQCIERLSQFRPDFLFLQWELHWGGAEGVIAFLAEDRASLPTVVASDRSPEELARRLPEHVVPVQKPFSLAFVLQSMRTS